MIRKLSLLFAALICLQLPAFSQYCGFDQINNHLLATNPAYAAAVQQNKNNWAQYLQNPANALVVTGASGTVYQIPVVIHVINTGGAVGSNYNPSTAQLTALIAYLNQAWAATYPAYPSATTGGTYIPIQFVLASRSPTCGATTGIERINGSSLAGYANYGVNSNNTNGASEASVKALSDWPPADYVNIWVVDKIDGADGYTGGGSFTAGYAYLPPAPANLDGIILLASQAITGSITLPHEMGHVFGLLHTFNGGNTTTCPPVTSGGCTVDNDEVCDTEPEMQSNFNCPSGINPCTSVTYAGVQHNFMDYSSCQNKFTPGQETKIIYGMNNYRASLLSSLGTTAPAAALTTASCIPTIVNSGNAFDVGPNKVVLNDMTGSTPGGYTGDGNLVYEDFTCLQQANLVAGNTYPISVTTGGNKENVRVYLDMNNDGVFSTSELIFTHNGTVGNETHTGSFTVPTTGITLCTPIRMRVISDFYPNTSLSSCSALQYGQAEDYNVLIKGVSNSATVAIALTSGTNPSCTNSSLTFTATPTPSTVNTPVYKWLVNGVYTGITGTTYTNAALGNGNIVTARMVYISGCGNDSSISNAITVIRAAFLTPAVSIAVTAGSNPGCAGQSITFTATPTNGGTTPSYAWKVNGTTVATGTTYTTSTLVSGNIVTAVMTTSLSCGLPTQATSNAITISYGAVTTSDTVKLATGSVNPACSGKPVSFVVTNANGGTAPAYLWLVNGASTGVTASTFTTSTLNNGDSVQCLMVSNNPCVTAQTVLSNAIHMTIITSDTAKVSIALSLGSNPGCLDSLVQFTATATNAGPAPSYVWYLNGVKVANGPTYNNNTFVTGDVVTAIALVSSTGCYVKDTAFSNAIRISNSPIPHAPFISLIGNLLVADSADVQWFGPNGLIPGATSQSYHPTAPGAYYAVVLNTGCNSIPSNILIVKVLAVNTYNMEQVKIFPNPTTGQLNFDWGSKVTTARISVSNAAGQIVATDYVTNATSKQMNLSALANGTYFVVLKDDQGKTGTTRITLVK